MTGSANRVMPQEAPNDTHRLTRTIMMCRTGRLKIAIQGAVQGVGFRPFIYRLAREMRLKGWVLNSSQGVFIEAEGEKAVMDRFLERIQAEKPAPSHIQSFEAFFLDAVGYDDFSIRKSTEAGVKSVLVLPDIATCPACLAEIFDPGNRRYRYPFTNCTLCGPRFSIIQSLPYDRSRTTMAGFHMCSNCASEYGNPDDRRFHAQPNACPECGPQLSAMDSKGKTRAMQDDALRMGVETIKSGGILALKGIGGYQLLVDAGNGDAIERLRQRKKRNEKPFALMFSSVDVVRRVCLLNPTEKRALTSPEAPVVILDKCEKGDDSIVSLAVAPGNPTLGIMLPYTPLHHLLVKDLGRPVVATSGNISDEPICIDDHDALKKLGSIADLFLTHDRPIARYVDDSVVRVIKDREMMVRRARGYAPLPVAMSGDGDNVLAVGAHQKNTIALQLGKSAFVSQHIGDLENEESVRSFNEAINSLSRLYDAVPKRIVCDLHPAYFSTQYAQSTGLMVEQIQHHHAHICACMADNQLEGPVLGVAWDGTGLGMDQTVWGGEFLLVEKDGFQRVSHLRPFRLPGSEKAVKEPRRSALGLLWEMVGSEVFSGRFFDLMQSFSSQEQVVLKQMLEKGFNSPLTSSAGRLFDAVAALINQRFHISYEGQAAMELEFCRDGFDGNEAYRFGIANRVDWQPMIEGMLMDMKNGMKAGQIALKFHNGLVEAMVSIAEKTNVEKVVLSGGCFQNRYLTERAVDRLRAAGFKPYWHQRLPPNDGCISVGQLFACK